MTREKRRKLIGLLFVLPGLISYFAWTLYPIFKSFIMSLFEWNINPAIPNKFIGLANYFELFQDPKFYTSLKNTILYTVVTVPGQMILGFLDRCSQLVHLLFLLLL